MGWSSGSELAENIWDLVGEHIPSNKKKKIAKKFIRLFQVEDCDTILECEELMKDAGCPEYDEGKCEERCDLIEVLCPYHKWLESLGE